MKPVLKTHRAVWAMAAMLALTGESAIIAAESTAGANAGRPGTWREAALRATLKNKGLEAGFQAGQLVQLKDLAGGKTLLSVDPGKLPSQWPLFGSTNMNLDACEVTQEAAADSLDVNFRAPDGTKLKMKWTMTPGNGDLILQAAAETAQPVSEMRFVFSGCDIANYTLVVVDNRGSGREMKAPWNDFLGVRPQPYHPLQMYEFGPSWNGSFGQSRMAQPLVALFEGKGSGWFMEGRDPKIGPANVLVQGRGQTADMTMVRGFAVSTKAPVMFEIRMRPYQDHWQDAADPYIQWMEKEAGFTPLDKRPPQQAWINDIKFQTYVRVGDFAGLEALAKRVDPKKTVVGREVGWTVSSDYNSIPDYACSEAARKWFKKARELGFHVGAYFDTYAVSPIKTDLVKQLRPGLHSIGHDANGREQFAQFKLFEQEQGFLYCSPALKAWRDLLIQRIRDAVEAGVDVVYLDENYVPCGNWMVDGMTVIDGVMTLSVDVLKAYPHVVIETEQFNPMTAKHAASALVQTHMGHNLGGYLFSRFIKIFPEGVVNAVWNWKEMDQDQSWGYITPSYGPFAKPFQDFNLVPDPRLPLKSSQLFGFRGGNGINAYYEKHENKRGLVVYAPGKESQWFGTRYFNIKEWTGTGALDEAWMLYNGKTLLGLEPEKTYLFDPSVVLPPDKFHVTEVPADFKACLNVVTLKTDGPAPIDQPWLNTHKDDRTIPQDIGANGCYHKLTFMGKGRMKMHVPANVLVFLDGKPVDVDRGTKTASVQVDAIEHRPSVLLAYEKADVELVGRWVDLPWQVPPAQRSWYVGRHLLRSYVDGPSPTSIDANGFHCHVAGRGMIIGKFPKAKSILLHGAYLPRDGWNGSRGGDGVIEINGKEVLRVAVTPTTAARPARIHEFDADVSSFAEQYVFLEFRCDGIVVSTDYADWYAPQIIAE